MRHLATLVTTVSLVVFGAAGVAYAGGPAGGEAQGQVTPVEGSVIYFDTTGSDLDTASRAELDRVVTWLEEDPDRVLIIAPDPAEVQSGRYDAQLSDQRAQETADYLRQQGVESDRIVVLKPGETPQMAQGKQPEDFRPIIIATRSPAQAPQAEAEVEVEPGQADLDAQTEFEAGVEPPPTTEPATPPPTYTAVPEQQPEQERRGGRFTPHGLAVSVGGGVTGLIDSQANDIINEGGAWEARITYGTYLPVAFEAAYVGSAQGMDALGLDDDAILLGSGVEGVVRVNILQDLPVQPYVFGGAGYTYYNITNESFNTSNVDQDDHTFQIPLGAGVGFRAFGALLDIRGTVRPVFDDSMLDQATANQDDASLDNWGLTGRVGFEF